jgi:Tol biopolymer transport system component
MDTFYLIPSECLSSMQNYYLCLAFIRLNFCHFMSFLKKTGLKILISMFFMVMHLYSEAQFYSGSQLSFGKNRVQWDDERFWSFYTFDRFETYFYQNGQALAEYTARLAPKVLELMERKLDYTLYDNIQFIIFNNLTQLKESNIGLISEEQYNIGGVTYIVGTKVFIYFNGDHRDFDRQIKAGIANVLINQMLYGNHIATVVKNSTLINLPDWYLQGLINYLSEEWNPDIDNRVRDGIMSGRYSRFNNLYGDDALYAGHSIWNFIADKYDPAVIPRLLSMSRISRSVENSFVLVLGISFKTLLADWITYYAQRYIPDEYQRDTLTTPFPLSYKKRISYSGFSISPDAKYATWVANDMGRYRLYLRNLETGKTRRLMKMGHRLEEKVNYHYPLTAFHPSGKFLAIINEVQGNLWLHLYDLQTRKFTKRRIFNFEQVLSFSFNPSGSQFVMSAVQNGQSDIVVFNLASNTYELITRDTYDDSHPCFSADGMNIVFSSNRPNDTIRFDVKTFKREGRVEAPDRQAVNDIFVYNYRSKSKVLKRLTNTPLAHETHPFEFEKNYFAFLSDQNGISNRYFARFDSAIAFIDTTTHFRYFTHQYAVSNGSRGIIDQHKSFGANKFTETIFSNGLTTFYIQPIRPASTIKPVINPPSSYLPLHMLRLMRLDTLPDKSPEKPLPRKRFTIVIDDDPKTKKTEDESVDISNYEFAGIKKDTIVSIKKPAEFTLPKQRNYDVEFSINQLVNQADFSYINYSYQPFSGGGTPVYINPGFNALFKIGINDLLEDYRFIGGFRFNLSFNNTEYLLSYENLKKRVDKQIIFHRTTTLDGMSFARNNTNEVFYILKYPFSNVSAVKGSAILRNDRIAYLSTDLQNLRKPVEFYNWAGLKGEYVFDNTRSPGLNLYYGSRFKAFTEYYQLIDQEHRNLVVMGFDYRNYQRIHRTFIWANRIAASSSLGNSKLIYYMGGVDGWLLPKFNDKINVDPSQSYRFQTLATNLRGFDQNIRNGNSFFVINSELRLPLFRYFTNRPLRSEFLNNFQVVGFGDIGSAWTGINPYSEDNSLYTQIIEQYPVKVTLKNQRDPIVGGMGFGLRSRLLGYFVRADWAWGIEDLKMNKKRLFYLSFSLDF